MRDCVVCNFHAVADLLCCFIKGLFKIILVNYALYFALPLNVCCKCRKQALTESNVVSIARFTSSNDGTWGASV